MVFKRKKQEEKVIPQPEAQPQPVSADFGQGFPGKVTGDFAQQGQKRLKGCLAARTQGGAGTVKAFVTAMAMVSFFLASGVAPANAFFDDDDVIYLAQNNQDQQKPVAQSQDDSDDYDDEDEDEYDDEDGGQEAELIPDPIQDFNRGIYYFNDKLYFWLLKPVARGYGFIIPKELRIGIVNMFYNVRFPVRFINCLLQGKLMKSWYEFSEFFLNTTVGFLGLANVAQNYPNLQPSAEDLGQTFAVWGIGTGAYIMLPFFGPSSFRDGLGRLGDTFADPIWWAIDGFWESLAVRAGEAVNETSTRIGEYEALKEAAIDPYVMIRNAWVQNRNKLIAE